MASQHINIEGTASRLAADVRRFVDQLRALQALGIKVKDISDQYATGADWASLAAAYGTTAADAEIVYNLITNVQDDLDAADVNALIDRVG